MAINDVVLITIILFESEDGVACTLEANSVLDKSHDLAVLGQLIAQEIDEKVLTPINDSIQKKRDLEDVEEPIIH
jgi:hypothetical protein